MKGRASSCNITTTTPRNKLTSHKVTSNPVFYFVPSWLSGYDCMRNPRNRKIRTTQLTEIEINKLREECGVFGIYGHPEAARLTYLGLYALQHRGQESCGIVASDGSELRLEKAMGHVSEAFDQTRLDRLRGSSAIGHVRYSTAGDDSSARARSSRQPPTQKLCCTASLVRVHRYEKRYPQSCAKPKARSRCSFS